MAEIVLITGASSGIGEATAYAFARAQSDLFLSARRSDRLGQVADRCRQLGAAKVALRSHDLSVAGEGALLVQECLSELGGVDVLICNAGYGIIGAVQDISPVEMARIWQVNFQSCYESIHAALPHLLQQRKGHIVLVSSIIGKKAFPFSATYCATKFAQVGLGQGLWGELKPYRIGVSVICPGYTDTEFQSSARHHRGVRRLRRAYKGQSSEAVAAAIVDAVRRKKREVHLTLPGKLLLLIDRISPSLATRIAVKVAIHERK
ncbi:MAG: SDR family NAD(P)-dependent oxidoreductase [Acidobacteria bacterium]|nr:SDR family NAD(P)-dependent oxidoreductase [Acidobacteriota bacterium]